MCDIFKLNCRVNKSWKSKLYRFFKTRYQMSGNSTKMNLYLRAELVESLLMSVTQRQVNSWGKISVSLPQCVNQFQIVIEGVRGDDNTMLAVDDLKFNECEYPKPPEPPVCQPGQFQCHITKHCVDMSSTCDYNSDCCDGSDETGILCQEFYRYKSFNGKS